MSILKQFNLRFVVIMLMYGSVAFLFYRDEVLGLYLVPLAEWTAMNTSELIKWSGIDVLQEGVILTHPHGFTYEVAYTCTGLLPGATFIACILAYPGPLRNKWLGILLCLPVLLAVNYLRLVNLFFIGVYFPGSFELVHEVVWEGLQVVAFISLWLSWISWSENLVNKNPSGLNK